MAHVKKYQQKSSPIVRSDRSTRESVCVVPLGTCSLGTCRPGPGSSPEGRLPHEIGTSRSEEASEKRSGESPPKWRAAGEHFFGPRFLVFKVKPKGDLRFFFRNGRLSASDAGEGRSGEPATRRRSQQTGDFLTASSERPVISSSLVPVYFEEA